ncbi:MAG: fumarylacetoacetate hydrolase family protein [Pseudomonadota bacterium]
MKIRVAGVARNLAILTGVVLACVYLAWATSEDPKSNKASFENEPLDTRLAPIDQAVTLARHALADGSVGTLLVEQYDGTRLVGVYLRQIGGTPSSDPFEALASVDQRLLSAPPPASYARTVVDVHELLPAGPVGLRHIGIGTNFPEHAEEAQSESVFNFPKFGTATPARTSISAPEEGLLDYEVELCARFDRPITNVNDFDAAVKGLFLCADFTDRIKLLNLADFDNLDSGYGFSDAKSGPGFFPTGPFLVIPKDWATFVSTMRMTTSHNGEARQDARGGEMTLDFRALVSKVLSDMSEERFLYQSKFYKLAPNAQIDKDMTLMSGTSEGVIFTTPRRHDYIEIVVKYLITGAFVKTITSNLSLMDYALSEFIKSEQASDHFLKSGDSVRYAASGLGDIVVEITP